MTRSHPGRLAVAFVQSHARLQIYAETEESITKLWRKGKD